MVLPVPKEVLKLLFAGQLKWKEGQILLLNIPVFIAPVEYFEYITRFFNKKEDIDKIYLAGWVAGYEVTKRLMLTYRLRAPQERYTIAMNGVEIGGFGKYQTIEFIPGIRSHFRYYNNPLPKKFFRSNEKVCHFIRGFNAGGGTWVHLALVNCIEVDCAAVNGQFCEFINFTYKDGETISKYKNFIKEQFYDFDSIIKFEIDYIKKLGDDKYISIP